MINKTSFGEYFDKQRDRLEAAMQNKNTQLNTEWREDYDKRQREKKEKIMKQKTRLVKEVKENGNGELYIEFSEDELDQFGLKKGDKVEWMEIEDGEVWKKVTKNEWSI